MRAAIERLRETSSLDLALLLSLVLLLVRPGPPDTFWIATLGRTLAVAALLVPGWRRAAWLWAGLFAVHLLGFVVLEWAQSDNHKFVLTWWTLAIAVALSVDDAEDVLESTARWLIGLVFLFAAAWKLTLPAYLDGTAFTYLLVEDARLYPIAHAFGGFTSEMYQHNQAALADLRGIMPHQLAAVPLDRALMGLDGVGLLAQVLTWWTVVIEALLAVAFLAPGRRVPAVARNGLLLVFVVTTYPPTQVAQFGWIIVIMAIAQCRPEEDRLRMAFLLAFFLVLWTAPGDLRAAYYEWSRVVAGR